MNGYIYTLYKGADPGHGWTLTDPIFKGQVPTLGACVPNIRAWVKEGDWVFAISGRVAGQPQFVIGGFQVAEKIDHIAAYRRYPENRLSRLPDGRTAGNIIVTADGRHHPDDDHKNFEKRVRNYLVGGDSVFLAKPEEYDMARRETVNVLCQLKNKTGNRPFDLIGRQSKLSSPAVNTLRDWLAGVKLRS